MSKLSVIAFALACCTLSFPVYAYSQVAQEAPAFTSKAAISAMEDLENDLKKIEAEWQADVASAHNDMREKLESALKIAVDSKDFLETTMISSFLKTAGKEAKSVEQPIRQAKRIAELERKLKAFTSTDPIVGTWIHHNGNRTIFEADGFVTLRGSTIGLWRKRKDGVYFVAYLNSFGSGVSDEIRLHASGAFCDQIATDGRKLKLNRPKSR